MKYKHQLPRTSNAFKSTSKRTPWRWHRISAETCSRVSKNEQSDKHIVCTQKLVNQAKRIRCIMLKYFVFSSLTELRYKWSLIFYQNSKINLARPPFHLHTGHYAPQVSQPRTRNWLGRTRVCLTSQTLVLLHACTFQRNRVTAGTAVACVKSLMWLSGSSVVQIQGSVPAAGEERDTTVT